MTVKKYKWNGKYAARDGFESSQGDLTLTTGNVVMGSTTISETDIAKVDAITNGTVAVGKAVVPTTGKVVDTLDITAPKFNGTALGATATEIDAICDASASAETVTGAGAISISTAYTSLVTTGSNALTLAAPGAASQVRTKVIYMTTDGGDGTLASTNIVGQSSGSTSITFNDVGDYLILVAVPGLNKWAVVKEGGVTAA